MKQKEYMKAYRAGAKGQAKHEWIKRMRSVAGKKGSEVTHKRRYEILVELSAFGDKQLQNKLIKWPTAHLEVLLKFYKNAVSK